MSYCIALQSDIETLKIARKILIERGFEDDKEYNDAYPDYYGIAIKHYLHISNSLLFANHAYLTSETISCTSETLHKTIDLIIEKLKQH
jgi:hypothetical protein